MSSISARRAGLSLIYVDFSLSTHPFPHFLASSETVRESTVDYPQAETTQSPTGHVYLVHRSQLRLITCCVYIPYDGVKAIRRHCLATFITDLSQTCVIFGWPAQYCNRHLSRWVVQVEEVTRISGRNRSGISLYELSIVPFVCIFLITNCSQSLNDFKSTSWITPLAYGYLWASLLVSVAVYGVDTFTAVNLLVFDSWTSAIRPAVSIDISRWIFSVCIILSWANLGYEYWRAIRVMRRGAVAESYLDSLAVRVQCIRMGSNGRGWKRFLVFTELTKSKKGAEYVALFTYFSFQGRPFAMSVSAQELTPIQLGSALFSVLVPDRS